jgi:peptidyl-prolyl cis-trans isomerase D
MLEQLRRNSRSFIIWILFGIIIAVFIISFGPQASPDSLGCGYSKESALEVAGEEVSLNSWRFAMNGLKGGGPSPAQMRRQQAVDLLVERELLAQAAEKQGFRVSSEVVNQHISAGEFYILGHIVRMQDPGFFRDYRQLEMFANNLGLATVAQLAEEQRREHLAEMMRHVLAKSGTISEEEARQVYIHQNTKISADYVKFDVRRYASALALGEADIERYAAAHDADLKKAWDAEKAQWASAKPRVLARHILVPKQPPAKPADKKDDGKKDDARPAAADAKTAAADAKKDDAKTAAADAKKDDAKTAAADAKKDDAKTAAADAKKDDAKTAAADAKKDEAKKDDEASKNAAAAKARAEAIHARLVAGADFAAVAREVSEDKQSRARGGLLGWRPADSLGQGKEAVEATKKVAVGQISGVIESERGYHIFRIEERSDKALTYEQKRLDVAARLAADYYARELARRDAEKALAAASTTPLEQSFERKAAPPSPPAGMPQGLEGLPPELRRQIEQMQREGGIDFQTAPPAGAPPEGEGAAEGDGKQGSLIVREGADVLAQAGAAPPPATPPAAPAAKPPAAPAAPAQPADKPAADAGKPAADASKPAADAGKPAEELPAVTVEKPPLQSIGPVSRMGDFLAGLGRSEKMVGDLFEKLEVGKVAPQVYEVSDQGGDAFAIVMLKSREAADVTKFAESRGDIIDEMTFEKGVTRLTEWIRKRCEETSQAGQIKVSRQLFEEAAEDESAPQPGYQPCATLTELSASGQLGNRRADRLQ